nr:MAG TPA: hypothetical protein [Caudoviricetes sp.]
MASSYPILMLIKKNIDLKNKKLLTLSSRYCII